MDLQTFPNSMNSYLTNIQTDKIRVISLWLLGLGLVFSVATQLRFPGLPFGLGEVLLILWLLSTLAATRQWRSTELAGVFTFALTGTLLLFAGYFLTAYPEGRLQPLVLHNTLAYIFCAVLAINYSSLIHDKYENSLPTILLWAFLLSTLLALVFGVVLRDIIGIDVMYYSIRWQHLSENPNQFALLALPLPFLSVFLILRQKKQITVP